MAGARYVQLPGDQRSCWRSHALAHRFLPGALMLQLWVVGTGPSGLLGTWPASQYLVGTDDPAEWPCIMAYVGYDASGASNAFALRANSRGARQPFGSWRGGHSWSAFSASPLFAVLTSGWSTSASERSYQVVALNPWTSLVPPLAAAVSNAYHLGVPVSRRRLPHHRGVSGDVAGPLLISSHARARSSQRCSPSATGRLHSGVPGAPT